MAVTNEGEPPFGLLSAEARVFEETDEASGEVGRSGGLASREWQRLGYSLREAPHGGGDDRDAAGLGLKGSQAESFGAGGGNEDIHGGVSE